MSDKGKEPLSLPKKDSKSEERPPEGTPIDPATGKPYKSGEVPFGGNEPV
jgi:hypothetical protein